MISLQSYGELGLSEDPIITLPCGHFYAVSTLDGLLDLRSAYACDERGELTGLRSLRDSNLTEKLKLCPECRAPIHSVNRYGRILKFSELRALERKHMLSIDHSLRIVAASENEDMIRTLEKLENQIKRSPMKAVWEASAGNSEIEVAKPPSMQHITIIELLAVAHSSKVQALDDSNYKQAVGHYERGIQLATESASHMSNARLRLAFASLMVNWSASGPLLKAEVRDLLQWIFDQDGRMQDLKEKATKLLDDLLNDRKVIAEVVAAMNRVDGYNYGGSWASHWYQCPNGHPFFIGDCGGAMEVSTCIECGERIGGQGHALLASNQQAGGVVADALRGT